jgi:hypothetical protein
LRGDLQYDLGAPGLFLRVGGIQLVRGSVLLPLASIGPCSRSVLPSHSDTNLWLPEVETEVSVEDASGEIFQWCRNNGITVVDSATALKMKAGVSLGEK